MSLCYAISLVINVIIFACAKYGSVSAVQDWDRNFCLDWYKWLQMLSSVCIIAPHSFHGFIIAHCSASSLDSNSYRFICCHHQ